MPVFTGKCYLHGKYSYLPGILPTLFKHDEINLSLLQFTCITDLTSKNGLRCFIRWYWWAEDFVTSMQLQMLYLISWQTSLQIATGNNTRITELCTVIEVCPQNCWLWMSVFYLSVSDRKMKGYHPQYNGYLEWYNCMTFVFSRPSVNGCSHQNCQVSLLDFSD